MLELARQTHNLLGVHLTAQQLRAFEEYEQSLLEWNQRINLTSIIDPGQIRVKHFLDSLSCLLAMSIQPMTRLIDIGTGAGFPGLPIKILYPDIRLTLVESIGKKADFCSYITCKLKLDDVEVLNDRVEILGQHADHRQRYDWAVARAVAVLPALAEYMLPLVRVGGAALAMKGETAAAEVNSADYAIRLLGGQVRKMIPVVLPGVADERYLVVIDKIAATPLAFPRKVGIPTKKPLMIKAQE